MTVCTCVNCKTEHTCPNGCGNHNADVGEGKLGACVCMPCFRKIGYDKSNALVGINEVPISSILGYDPTARSL